MIATLPESPLRVIVGQTYNIPCVPYRGQLVPVLLPAHRDTNKDCLFDIGDHYHIDYRFIDPINENGIVIDAMRGTTIPDFQESRFVCLREKRLFPRPWPFFISRMYKRFANHTLVNNICPHQGLQITNPCGTCPGHGLAWNLETKRLRYQPPFYLVTPGGDFGLVLESGNCLIHIQQPFTSANGFRLKLVDSMFVEYPDATIYCELETLEVGKPLNINDTNCGIVA